MKKSLSGTWVPNMGAINRINSIIKATSISRFDSSTLSKKS